MMDCLSIDVSQLLLKELESGFFLGTWRLSRMESGIGEGGLACLRALKFQELEIAWFCLVVF